MRWYHQKCRQHCQRAFILLSNQKCIPDSCASTHAATLRCSACWSEVFECWGAVESVHLSFVVVWKGRNGTRFISARDRFDIVQKYTGIRNKLCLCNVWTIFLDYHSSAFFNTLLPLQTHTASYILHCKTLLINEYCWWVNWFLLPICNCRYSPHKLTWLVNVIWSDPKMTL